MAIIIDCPIITPSNQSLCVELPGGSLVCAQLNVLNPDDFAVSKQLLAQVNAALAPLTPVFNIIDAILAIKECVEAIPDALGPPPDPAAMAACIPDLAKKVEALLSLIPGVSVPRMVVDILDVLIVTLNSLISQLRDILVKEALTLQAGTKAAQPGNESLLLIVECSEDFNLALRLEVAAGIEPLNRLIGITNLFLELIGLDPIPDLADLPADTQESIDQLRVVTKLLTDLRNAIPIP